LIEIFIITRSIKTFDTSHYQWLGKRVRKLDLRSRNRGISSSGVPIKWLLSGWVAICDHHGL